jgi:O-antigen ligase
MALFWYWAQARPGFLRQVVAFVAMAACVMVLMATGSRSAILGLVALGVILQTAPRGYRVRAPQFAMLAAVGALTVALFVPPETFSRMIDFTPQKGEVGASSNVMREETLQRAWQMSADYPLFGVGLGNFREVSRQIYKDDYYRPPHNSYLWAMSEGGIFVLAGYLLLFWVTWKDLQVTRRLAHRDPEIEVWTCAIRAVFLLFFFYSLFADLWLNPIIYALLGLVISTRQYVESLPDVVHAAAPRSRWPARVAR